MNKVNMFVINHTNMHVGSGENGSKMTITEYAKDYFNNAPIIPASGFKGALRQNFTMNLDETKSNEVHENNINSLFGTSEKKVNDNQVEMQMGNIVFNDVKTLFYPVRTNAQCEESFIYITTEEILEDAQLNKEDILKSKIGKYINTKEGIVLKKGDYIENIELTDNLTAIKGTKLLVVKNDMFKTIMNMAPVITRNKVATEDDSSNNVWSEEIVPRKTVFYTSFFYNGEGLKETIEFKALQLRLNKFDTTKLNNMLQIGGNASIGMGYCQLIKGEEI